MKFMTQWKVMPGKLLEAVDRFLTLGDPKPAGVRSLGRWFRTHMQGGYHLVEAERRQLLPDMAPAGPTGWNLRIAYAKHEGRLSDV